MISLIVLLILAGVGLYLIGLIPMDTRILMAIRCIVLLFVVLYVLQGFGLLPANSFPRWR